VAEQVYGKGGGNLLEPNDRLLLFGYGLFETLKVHNLQIQVPWLHYERMKEGAAKLGLLMPSYEEWFAGLKQYLQNSIFEIHNTTAHTTANKPPSTKSAAEINTTFALRVTLSGGSFDTPPQWLYHRRPIPYTEEDYRVGIAVTILSVPRNEHSPLVQIKSTNYMENILGKQEAETKGCREGIWLNTKGFLAEGTMSNLFFVREGCLYTPSLSCGCLPGTRRQLVVECAQRLGIACVEGEFSLEFFAEAEEVFLTNSLMGIMPVYRVDERRVPEINFMGEALRREMDKIIRE